MRQNVEPSGIYLTSSAVGARLHLYSYRTDKRGATSARSAFFLTYRVSMAGNCTFLLRVPTIRCALCCRPHGHQRPLDLTSGQTLIDPKGSPFFTWSRKGDFPSLRYLQGYRGIGLPCSSIPSVMTANAWQGSACNCTSKFFLRDDHALLDSDPRDRDPA
jgi:hypothetical protein